MNEDIKTIEGKLEIIESLCTDDCINKSTVIQPLIYALKNLIARYKELEKENEEIKKEFALNTEIHKRDEIIKDLKETISCLHETDKENYIPKSKIKEKIEELNDVNSKFSQRVIKSKEFYLTELVQNILQELLED